VETTSEDDESFEVKIASSGATFSVPKDKSVYEVLSENGIDIMVSCEQGVCGTCLTRVLEGEPDHRDLYLDDDERAANDQFTPCCSRAKSKTLVLDL
jgi:vanillate O-demethylase ferredoxin subunit